MRSGPPSHADHVGSLLRPSALKEAFRDRRDGGLDDEGLLARQNESIREVVALQESIGLEAVTDGELRRASYWSHFVEGLEGMSTRPARFTFHDGDGHEAGFLAPHVEGRLRRPASICGPDFRFLRETARKTPKITLPSPSTLHFWRGAQGVDRDAYPEDDELFEDLASVYRQEIEDLVSLGATYIQLDEVPLAMLCDPGVRERVAAAGEAPEDLVDRYLALVTASIPSSAGVTFAMHLCRGNYKGRWLSEGSYSPIAERLFNEIPIDVFLLEYDTERAGDFAPLSHLPSGKRAYLGLVSTKTPDLEHPDDLRRRLDRASAHADLGRLGLCPQCGFASTVGGNPLTQDDQRRKLDLVVETAADVWGA